MCLCVCVMCDGAGNTDSICIGTGVDERPKPNDFICCETQSPVGSFMQDKWMMETTFAGVRGCMLCACVSSHAHVHV